MSITVIPERGLPLARRRSAVFSPRRNRSLLALERRATLLDLGTAVAVVLARYHGLSTVPIGMGLAQPRLVEVELRPGGTLADVRDELGRLLEAAGESPPVEGGSRNPDFDVAVLGAAPRADLREDVVLHATSDGIEALWRARLFDEPTVERFLGHLRAVLEASPELEPDDVQLSSAEEEALLRGFEDGGPPLGREAVHVQVAKQAGRTPQAPALRVKDRALSYAELDRRSAAIREGLRAKGVRPGDAVALSVSAAAGVPALLGILRTGAAVVPLDPTFPESRLRSQIEQAGVRTGLVDSCTRSAVPLEDVLSIDEIDEMDEIDGGDHDATAGEAVEVDPESIAYVLFTSGSTGAPKGIRMPHRSLTNLIAWQVARSAPAPTTLHRTSLAFDVGMQEVFSTLCSGGCLIVADEDTRADPSMLPEFIDRHGIQRIFLPPVSLYEMASAIDADVGRLDSLREVYVAGESLNVNPTVVRAFRRVNAVLENQYGPTETHVVTTFSMGDSPLRWSQRPPIGRPVPGVEVRILDPKGRRVAVGTAGEIVVRGSQVARGYLWGEEFLGEDGVPAYATGDLGRWTRDGEIEFLGRADRQVKVRGYRIELGEIEAAFLRQPEVRAAVVSTLEDGDTRRLAAWLVPESEMLNPSAVRERLLEILPQHMVPALSAISLVEALPLTSTGKVDVAALPSPDGSLSSRRVDYVPSRNELESVVSEIWRRELGLDRVGVHDDFLELGGHSLLAIRIVSRINERFGVSLPLRVLLREGTVAKVAERLSNPTAARSTPAKELTICRLPDGRTVLAPFDLEVQYLWEDVFVEDSYGAPVQYAGDAVMVDVGAHVGLFALYGLQAAPHGRVVAIEPVPVLFEALKANTAEHSDRIRYHGTAVGDEDGDASITYYPEISGMSSLRADGEADARLLRRIMQNLLRKRPDAAGMSKLLDGLVAERMAARELPCRIRRLQAILDEDAPDRIDVLKIDVQRHEEAVLRGVGDAWERVRQVVVEVHDENGALARIQSFLRERRFEVAIRQLAIHEGTPVRMVVGRS